MTTPSLHGPAGETTTAPPAGLWPNAPKHPVCQCGHGIGMHAIRANGSRGACSVLTGPRGAPCECRAFKETT